MSMSPANHFEGITGSADIGSADTYIGNGAGASAMRCRECGAEPVHSQVIPTAPVASPSGRGDLAALSVVMPSMPLDKPLPVAALPMDTFVSRTIGDPIAPPTPIYTSPAIGRDVVNGDVYAPPVALPPLPPTLALPRAQGRLPCC
jgi:hypothetical protein